VPPPLAPDKDDIATGTRRKWGGACLGKSIVEPINADLQGQKADPPPILLASFETPVARNPHLTGIVPAGL
jgi:hypothetical protein